MRSFSSSKRSPAKFFTPIIVFQLTLSHRAAPPFFCSLKDDASAYRYVYFIKHKSDVYENFVQFANLIFNKFNRHIRAMRWDNGGEFCSNKMKDFLKNLGTDNETTAPYTPQQNGKSERENRTIVESVRTMMLAAKAPRPLWAEAVNTAVHVLSMTSTARHPNTTPYQMWWGKIPDFSHLRVFGSTAFVGIPNIKR